MGPVMRRLAAIAIAGIAHTTVGILQSDLFLFKIAHASQACEENRFNCDAIASQKYDYD